MTQHQKQALDAIYDIFKSNDLFGKIVDLSSPVMIEWYGEHVISIQMFEDGVPEIFMDTPGEPLISDINGDDLWKIHTDLKEQFAS